MPFLKKSTILHLRFPFSFYLLPVFLFALSQAHFINWINVIIAFVILHLLIFPSCNGYNSFQDKDESSIGGLKYPPKVTIDLYYTTLLMDVTGILCALLVSIYFSTSILIMVLASRAYSYRKLRLKKYALTGFLTVFIFQGAFVYLSSSIAISKFSLEHLFSFSNIICMSIASLFIGSIYPLTQIYQHKADLKDGVESISYKLGFAGTFIFSALLFTTAALLMFYYFNLRHQMAALTLFFLITLPVILWFILWFLKTIKNNFNANYENTMIMTIVTSGCMNLYFLVLILNNYLSWF
jgi:1,4-dihydroxy-2-naphthoate polyprenyltransferase